MEKIEEINKTMKPLKPTPTTLYKLQTFNILDNCFVSIYIFYEISDFIIC